MEVLRDLKLVDKILHFWSDRNFKVRCVLMTLLPRIRYYLNREETVEYDRVVSEYSNSKDLYIREVQPFRLSTWKGTERNSYTTTPLCWRRSNPKISRSERPRRRGRSVTLHQRY